MIRSRERQRLTNILAVDVGNSNTVFGFARRDLEEISPIWRLASRRDRPADEWFSLLVPLLSQSASTHLPIEGMILSSVVPAITTSLTRFARRHLQVEPLIVNAGLELGITVQTERPFETGSDRIANCVAAYARFGGPTVVVDVGTATKIEAITASGEFLGGVIAPGLDMSLEALAHRAARLFAVELKRPDSAIGRNTTEAIQAGVVEGHLAMIEGMVARLRAQLGGVQAVVLTGGQSEVFAHVESVITDVIPNLTLDGLRLIYLQNRPRSA